MELSEILSKCDHTLLSHGQILEQGTHQQLLSQRGRYYRLYTLQFTKQQLIENKGNP